jgi:hypothetical protein
MFSIFRWFTRNVQFSEQEKYESVMHMHWEGWRNQQRGLLLSEVSENHPKNLKHKLHPPLNHKNLTNISP